MVRSLPARSWPPSSQVLPWKLRGARGCPGPFPGAADAAGSRVPGHTAPTASPHSQLLPPRARLLDVQGRVEVGPQPRAPHHWSCSHLGCRLRIQSPHLVGDVQLRARSPLGLGVVSQKEAGLVWTPAVTLF